ncbi:4Fe-4S dicluster domain-containing protein [Alkaliphilus hydrothermalis]|uniref:Ferredoxin n=1 Tax=Alkaliphilus hydrothermalis TaxID=1482730 RepID=A0ABS2NMD2_9FIRM|nr:reductive dehalogenase domain-containing protein [Alkaliphilus hydrothermalis]MBM7614080.1 ferredoxin [Alkaliphilus hydrothermalis]
MKRVDERDIIFARASYKKGSSQYEDYYKRNPEKQEIDDTLREAPHPYGEGTATYNPINSAIADATFHFLGDMKKYSEGKINPNKVETTLEEITKKIKGLANFYGASLVGITKMKEEFYYSHRGRHPENYGEPVTQHHKYGIVFAVEMDRDMINRAPLIGEGIEVTKGYVNAAVVGMILSYFIREIGYDARNHMDGNYLVIAPLVAEAAALGEIGRHGLLITREHGPRVRLGVVTTDLELICDEVENLGIREFCRMCNNCAMTCPGKAIPHGPQKEIEGENRWKIQAEDCFSVWKRVGTDCGVCLSSCPFSHGMDEELIKNLAGNPENIKKALIAHKEKYGIRPFNHTPHPWL